MNLIHLTSQLSMFFEMALTSPLPQLSTCPEQDYRTFDLNFSIKFGSDFKILTKQQFISLI